MTPTAGQVASARWVAALFLAVVVLQRFAVPGLPMISILIPVTLAWCALAFHRKIVDVDATRLTAWLVLAVVTGMLVLLQNQVVPGHDISVQGWLLVLVVWMPFTFRIHEGGVAAYFALLRHVCTICTALACASVAMLGIQFAGVGYQDWFAKVVPNAIRLQGFNTSYPIEFGSSIYKSNAFIGLEASFISAFLGIGIIAAILVQARVWQVAILILGMAATVAGSGIVTVIVGGVVIALHASRTLLKRFVVPGAFVAIVAVLSPVGRPILDRAFEFQSDQSSTSLRAIEPYRVLYPMWTEHLSGVLVGYGPGSSQRVADTAGIFGLLIPTPAKILYEYGLVGAVVLGGFLLACYWGGPSRAFGLALLVSIWALQSGLATPVIVLPVLLLVTLWSPRTGRPIEALARWRQLGDKRTGTGVSQSPGGPRPSIEPERAVAGASR